jgi:glycosyltransferase involved in cell wall biosynthesis
MITVVLPCRNRSANLKNCINCILCQTCQDFEIIVVDYGGSDGMQDMLQQYLDSRIK